MAAGAAQIEDDHAAVTAGIARLCDSTGMRPRTSPIRVGSISAKPTPAAFTQPTGAAHWHILLRARAIEAGAFVVAAAQTGVHEDGRATYGHSLVIDPWGDVLLDMGEAAGVGFAEIDPARIDDVRGRIPVLSHRRAIPEVTAA